MAKAKAPADPKAAQRQLQLLLGVLLLLVGTVVVLYGIAPLAGILDLFGGAPPQEGFMDPLIADMKAGVVWDVLGLVLAAVGGVFVKLGTRKPKPKSIDEQVNEAVERRLRELQQEGAVPAGPIPQTPTAAAPPRPASPAAAKPAANSASAGLARCPTCGGPLVAGRYCRSCGT